MNVAFDLDLPGASLLSTLPRRAFLNYSKPIKSTILLTYKPSNSIVMHLLPPLVLLSGLLSSTLANATTPRSPDAAPALHFTLTRRGGKFSPTEFAVDYVNLTYLAQELEKTEARFNLTKREVKGNKLVRKPKSNDVGGKDSNALMGEVATDGIW